MSNREEFKKLKKVTERIVQEYKPEKIILFGSYAWGRPTADSDFDLCIINNRKRDFYTETRKVHRIIDGEITADVLVYSNPEIRRRLKLGDFFFRDIIKKGKVLYEKERFAQ